MNHHEIWQLNIFNVGHVAFSCRSHYCQCEKQWRL